MSHENNPTSGLGERHTAIASEVLNYEKQLSYYYFIISLSPFAEC